MNKFIFGRVSNLSFAFTFSTRYSSTRYSSTRFTDQPISVNLFKIILKFQKRGNSFYWKPDVLVKILGK